MWACSSGFFPEHPLMMMKVEGSSGFFPEHPLMMTTMLMLTMMMVITAVSGPYHNIPRVLQYCCILGSPCLAYPPPASCPWPGLESPAAPVPACPVLWILEEGFGFKWSSYPRCSVRLDVFLMLLNFN